MGQLSRKGRLLTMVKGRPHASSDDHHEDDACLTVKCNQPQRSLPRKPTEKKSTAAGAIHPAAAVIVIDDSPSKKPKKEGRKSKAEASLPSPNQTDSSRSSRSSIGNTTIMIEDDADVDASPQSSDENDYDYHEPINFPAKNVTAKGSGFKTSSLPAIGKSAAAQAQSKKPTFKTGIGRPASPKRKLSDTELDDISEDDAKFDSMMSGYKKPQHFRSVRKNEVNMFVRPSKKLKTFGKRGKAQEKREEIAAAKAARVAAETAEKEKLAKKRSFKTVALPQIAGGDSSQSTKAFNASFASTSAELEGMDADMSPLSELSDEEIEELDMFEGFPAMKCSFCSDRVKKSLLEDFQIEFLKGRPLTYKWQRRFCTWHKRQAAQETWRKRGYPAIDWSRLARRMRQHEAVLISVINNEVESHYRKRLQDKSKQGLEGLKDDITDEGHGKGGASMGYYGSKGEKIITEHIVTRLSSAIRKRSTKDKLVSAASIQGGVAGFVQIVLAPHLAELLVKEDMNLEGADWDVKAREIIAESAEVGDLLNPEENGSIDDGAHDIGLANQLQDDEGEEEDSNVWTID